MNKVLDIAAGHGIFGIEIDRRFPKTNIVAVDWPNVLEVAKEQAQAAGVDTRYGFLPGNAFEVDYGGGYDVILLTNFLHHFDPQTCEGLLRKLHSALNEHGRVMTLEFVPHEDRVSPSSADFALRKGRRDEFFDHTGTGQMDCGVCRFPIVVCDQGVGYCHGPWDLWD